MWGSTTPNTASECTWASYKYCKGTHNTLTKYNFSTLYGENPDNKTTLEPEDDAATQIMGSDWRMPTEAEFQELIDYTTHEWIDGYNGTGVRGMKFTSKTGTSKYIFIPAAGTYHNGSLYNEYQSGYVWSSSLETNSLSPDRAWGFDFGWNSDYSSEYCYTSKDDRCGGRSVRGVRK